MFTTEEFRTRIYLYYEENGITVGDPSVGNWENAHIVPKCKGGTETVLLLEEHHIMHDLYQSREYNHQCFYAGTTRAWLYGEGFLCENWFELVELYEYYSSRQAAQNAADGWAKLTPEERTAQGRRVAQERWASVTPEERESHLAGMRQGRQRMWDSVTPEERTAQGRRLGQARWAKVRADRALRSLGADLYGALWAAEPL